MYKRRKKLVRADVQFRVVLIALLVASLVLLVNFHLSLTAVGGVAAKWSNSLEAGLALKELKSCILSRFVLSVGVLVPLAIGLGVVYSFKFAGPIYKFKKFFTELKTGPWNSRCALRKGDDLQDLCGAINAGLRPMHMFLEDHRDLLRDARELLEQGEPVSPEKVDEVKRRISGALEVCERRLPDRSPSKAAASTPEGETSPEALESKEEELQPQA